MKKESVLLATIAGLALLLSGCVVKTYPLVKDRVDQDLTGNQGYLAGQAPETEAQAERPTTRTTQVVEIELHSPIKFVRGPKRIVESNAKDQNEMEQGETAEGNKGFIFRKGASENAASEGETALKSTQYTVKKNDTLQKISKEFYGTTKRWNKIYNANRETLKGPNKLYPGQVLNIPEGLKEPEGNLK